jgi:hypothetical protein
LNFAAYLLPKRAFQLKITDMLFELFILLNGGLRKVYIGVKKIK